MAGIYTQRMSPTTVATAITIVQVKAGVDSLDLLRCGVFQTGIAGDPQVRMQLVRKTVAATVTSKIPTTHAIGGVSTAVGGTGASGVLATVEGTDGDVLHEEYFYAKQGFIYIPTIQEQDDIRPGEIVALKFPDAPPTATWVAFIRFLQK